MDEFLKTCTTANQKSRSMFEKLATKYIIEDLMVKNLRGKKKILNVGLDECYEMESLLQNPLLPGHVYIFIYNATNHTKVKIKEKIIDIEDRMPVVLCLGFKDKNMFGINLNMCPYDVRVAILNEITNLDVTYYTRDIPINCGKGQHAVSPTIIQMFASEKNQRKFTDYFCNKYSINKNQLTFRYYDINKIKNIRMVEVWGWKYIPFLEYRGSIKQQEMKLIHDNLKTK